MPSRIFHRIGQWEVVLAGCVIVLIVVASISVNGFLTPLNIRASISVLSDTALMILPLTMIIIVREIDISVASMAALTSACAGMLMQNGTPAPVGIIVALIVGLACGAFNGFCVTILGLPSLVVTLGTLSLFRGLCYVLLGSNVVTAIPAGFVTFSNDALLGGFVPLDILPFVVIAIICAVVLHKMPVGRRIFAIGGNPDTALYSGVSRRRILMVLYMFSGFMAAIAGLINMGLTSQASPDAMLGRELVCLTIVFLGGVDFLGGKGRYSGVVLSLLLVITLTSTLQLLNVSSYAQGTATGLLLIFSLLLSNIVKAISNNIQERRKQRLRLSVPASSTT